MSSTLILIAVASVIVFVTIAAVLSRYKRCSSDNLLVVYGKTGKKGDGSGESSTARVLHGGGAFVWPVIQDYEYLDLKPIQIPIELEDALSKQNIRIAVPSSVTVAISPDPQVRLAAAERLLGLERAQIAHLASDIIFGQMRQVIAQMTIEEINANREALLANISKNLETELHKIGIKLINVNIRDIKDDSGYLNALGKKAASEALNKANIDVAQNEREGGIGVAEAERDRRIKTSELHSEAAVGEAKATADAEIGKRDAESNQRIKTASLNATAIEGENKAAVEIANTTADRKMAEAEASRKSTTAERTKAAQALKDSYTAEKEAEETRAQKDKATYHANVVVPAEVQKEKQVIDAQAEAEKIREIAKGSADAQYAKMEALARGDYERLAKMANGLKEIVDAAGGDPDAAVSLMIADKLEDLYKIRVEAIKNIKIDKVTVWDQGGGSNGGSSTANFLDSMLTSVPGFEEVYRMAGKELPAILQGAGTKEKAKLDASVSVEELPTGTSETATEDTTDGISDTSSETES